jgi:hypothetical protein
MGARRRVTRQWWLIATIETHAGIVDAQSTSARNVREVRAKKVAHAPCLLRGFESPSDAGDGDMRVARNVDARHRKLSRSLDADSVIRFRILDADHASTRRYGGATEPMQHRTVFGESVVDKFIRFVARDSSGRCFLWSMHWGEAGYGCRIASLTASEERALYEWGARRAEAKSASVRRRPPPRIADQAPLSGSFVESENAVKFFSKNGDPELERWARIMFQQVSTDTPPSTDTHDTDTHD